MKIRGEGVERKQQKEEQEFLQNYHAEQYERPSVTVDIALLAIGNAKVDNYRKLPEKKLKVLLVKRDAFPYKECWALPGVFATPNEELEDAAIRGLEKKTGVDNIYLEQLYTIGTPNRDPRTWVITCAYMALVNQEKVEHIKEGEEVGWFEISLKMVAEEKEDNDGIYTWKQHYELSLTKDSLILQGKVTKKQQIKNGTTRVEYELTEQDGLAFDHGKILTLAVERLRGKMEYSDVSFHLVPERFTLTELQNVYETVLDTKLLAANFRRKLADKVEMTDEYAENGGHRPSRLYKRVLK